MIELTQHAEGERATTTRRRDALLHAVTRLRKDQKGYP
jgi:hypothetical protein